MCAIRTVGVGKAYKQYRSQWARLAEWLRPLGKPTHEKHWVLHDIDLDIAPGEAVGLVGSNGAGKSTLLKIISGTVRPSVGEIQLNGTVAAMLELGMGFHPDFTGRQNAIMGAQLLGIARKDIDALMPAIESFAEIGEYIDQPVRTYSSGMQMRLAFSVATARRPDILIIDEALSVGDAYFQHKSFARIRSFRKEGTTLLIVSHDRYAIQTVCDRAILLDKGRVTKQGLPIDVLDFYHAQMAERQGQTIRQHLLPNGQLATTSGSGEVQVIELGLFDAANQPIQSVRVGQFVQLIIKIRCLTQVSRTVLGFMITDRLGQVIYGINTHRLEQPLVDMAAGEEAIFRFGFEARLGKGSYSISTSLSRNDSHLEKNYEWREKAVLFHVVNVGQEDFVGSCWLDAKVDIERLDCDQRSVITPLHTRTERAQDTP